MEKNLVEKKVSDFVDAVASDSPAPGGGSVAALSSAMGAGLLCMAIRISTKKEANASLSDLLSQLENERKRLMQLVDEDTEAFNHVMAAFAMPKGTDEEKAARLSKVQAAFKHAASVPLETMHCSLRVLEAGQTVARLCSPNVASDVGTGIQMTYAGLQGAGYNVKINLAAIKDEAFKADLKKKAEFFLEAAETKKSNALMRTESKL
ncbi:cyclodeaminase/cyclohydrolase family protein [Candidatus Micrarchaeota archaeon]|nr:cyclodeaminase/cyclohydrolase family protein [Candidatus Micrarchaeota archaeon]